MEKEKQESMNEKALYLLNNANENDLDNIPGMTTKLAQAVFRYCQDQGITDWQTLKQVTGISEQRIKSIRTYYITKAADSLGIHDYTPKSKTNGNIITIVSNSIPVKLVSIIGGIIIFIFTIVQGIASFTGAKETLLGTPTPTTPVCHVQADNSAELVPVYKDASDAYHNGLYGELRPPSGLRYIHNLTPINIIRAISTTTNSQSNVSRYEITADYFSPIKVVWVQPRTVADKAGFLQGDIILKMNGIEVDSIVDYLDIVNKSSGAEIRFEIERTFMRSVSGKAIIGIGFTDSYSKGLLITDVFPNGPALKAGFEVDDIITAINGVNVTPQNIRSILDQFSPSDSVSVTFTRNNSEEVSTIILGEAGGKSTLTLSVIPSINLPEEPLPIVLASSVQDKGRIGLYLDDQIESPLHGYIDVADIVCTTSY